MADDTTLVSLSGVTKEFPHAPGAPRILTGVDLEVGRGESVAIVGPSGCGKSTLLNLIGALDTPSAGTVTINGQDISKLNETELAKLRNRSIGFVFQLHHLLPQCTAIENVLVPTLVNADAKDVRARAEQLLERVGLKDRMHYYPGQLSGGERQRVAVVRALINEPQLLLADEPTGSLNPEGATDLAKLMTEINQEEGMALIVVTHAPDIAATMSRTLEIKDGTLHPMETAGA